MSTVTDSASFSAAFLVFEPASATAWIVAADPGYRQRLRTDHLPFGKIPAAIFSLELPRFVMLALGTFLCETGDEFNFSDGVVNSAPVCADDFKSLPFGGFSPLLRAGVIVPLAVVGVGTIKDKIHLCEDVGRIAGAHKLLGGGCRPPARDDRFAAPGVGAATSAWT